MPSQLILLSWRAPRRPVFPQVVMTDIKRDKVTGRNLGYGFVQMSTREEALAARERMQGAEIQGRRIRVGWAQRNTMLFVGDLDETVTLEVLAEAFRRFGPLLPEHTYVRSGKFGTCALSFVWFRLCTVRSSASSC